MNRVCTFCCSQSLEFKLCSVCRVTMYCSRDCRERDWSDHKKLCDYSSRNDELDHEEMYLRSKSDLNRLIHALDMLAKPKGLTIVPKSLFEHKYSISSEEARGFVVVNDKLAHNTVYYIVEDSIRRFKRSKYTYNSTNNNEMVVLIKNKYPSIVGLSLGKVFVLYDPKPGDSIVDSVRVYDI
jgi:hypothetical protein